MDTENIKTGLEYLCRLCAANTKPSKQSVAECVYIFKTPGLKENIERFLYLTISENDQLPKILCKICFRQVATTASLSSIAKHTQKVFTQFLSADTQPHKEFNIDYDAYNVYTETPQNSSQKNVVYVPEKIYPTQPAPAPQVAQIAIPKLVEPISAIQQNQKQRAPTPPVPPREVVVNVSINDPLTRETQQKMINASQRRQSVFDNRFAPKSIAQRSFTNVTPKQPEVTAGNKIKTLKKHSPPGVLNFVDGKPQKVTTIPTDKYTIGRLNTNELEHTSKRNLCQSEVNSSSQIQKRKNFRKELNNAKAKNSSQVSLLKSSCIKNLEEQEKMQIQINIKHYEDQEKHKLAQQQHQTEQKHHGQQQNRQKQKKVKIIENELSKAEELPEKIIYAAPKHLKQKTTVNSNVMENEELHHQNQTHKPQTSTKSSNPEEILLGRVIKDFDLLKLILKALKWPTHHKTISSQMNRLRNSKFTDIISDPNLLQDTDLTTLLGPYLGPFVRLPVPQTNNLAALAQVAASQQLVSIPQELSAVENLANTIPYHKLPPETSVQLVPASPERETEDVINVRCSIDNKPVKRDLSIESKTVLPNKSRKTCISAKSPKAVERVAVDVEKGDIVRKGRPLERKTSQPSPFLGSGDSTNEALATLLERQCLSLNRLNSGEGRQKRRSTIVSESEVQMNIDDDVFLIEQKSETINNKIGVTSSETAVKNSVREDLTAALKSHFSVPSITRPIIKRRKTVIQISNAQTNLIKELQEAKKNVEVLGNKQPTVEKLNTKSMLKQTPLIQQAQQLNIQKTTAEASTSMSAVPKTSFIQGAKILPTVIKTTTSQITPKLDASKATKATSTNVDTKVTTSTSTSKPSIPTAPTMVSTSTSTTKFSASPSPIMVSTSTSITKLSTPTYAKMVSTSTSTTNGVVDNLIQESSAKKLHNSKSALGQQILEAFGIQPKATSASADNIRSVLKKSFKAAQEQTKNRKPEEPIKQDADSTTKSVKEAVIESKVEGDVAKKPEGISLEVKKTPGNQRKIITNSEPDLRQKKRIGGTIKSPRSSLVIDEKYENEKLKTIDEEASDHSETKIKMVNSKIKPQYVENAEANDEDDHVLNSSVSSTGMACVTVPKKRGRKPKDLSNSTAHLNNALAEMESIERIIERPRSRSEMSVRSIKIERDEFNLQESDSLTSTRPARTSKTLSKYYKGPREEEAQRRSIPTRSTTKRN